MSLFTWFISKTSNLEGWKAEADWWEWGMPIPATPRARLEQSIKKWKALDPKVLRRYGLWGAGNRQVIGPIAAGLTEYTEKNSVKVVARSCVLCQVHNYKDGKYCMDCPISNVRAGDKQPNTFSCCFPGHPYQIWQDTGKTKPMVDLLEAALKELDK